MSEADNRDADNLLLLCLLHAWEVDDVPEQYPAGLLREWKHAQLAEYERVRQGWQITDAEAEEAVTRVDLMAAIERIAAVMPFNPRMRSRVEAWQLAVRKGHARRVTRLKPLVKPERREAVLAWMATLDAPIVEVPPGEVRVLVARLGAGKSEQAARWWEQGLQVAASDDDIEVPLYFTPRAVISTLEHAVTTELGRDPTRPCRVVIDDLDQVAEQRAARLLTEARELVQVWPTVSVLATARPGITLPDEEKLTLDPWPVERGVDLAEVALGERIPPHLWISETADLLTSPLTALAVADRVKDGQTTAVSRARLLADLAPRVIRSHHLEVSQDTWQDLARLAVALLEQPESATAAMFHPLPRLRQLLASDLVVEDEGILAFALPVLEQYFGAEAIRSEMVDWEAVASAGSFPRWRYALAFAVSGAPAAEQETLLIRLARINPAAALWVLGEITDPRTPETLEGPAEEAIAALIRRRDPDSARTEPDLAIRAGLWLRDAEQALLTGLGPLAESLVPHRDGQPTQWGVWLQNGYLTLARAYDTSPPPVVIPLNGPHPNLADGWDRWTQFRFPTTEFGRWVHAQTELQQQLQTLITRRTLPVPRTSWLARERLHLLAAFVYDYGISRRHRPIQLAALRERVADWMTTVTESQRATWEAGGRTVDSDDIRWLSTQLALIDDQQLDPPWPAGDQPHTGKWIWQTYSPQLTLTLATAIVREALTGYHQLVDTNFPAFGNTLDLYRMLPARINGLVSRPTDQDDPNGVVLHLALQPDPAHQHLHPPTVDLRLITSRHDPAFEDFNQEHRHAVNVASDLPRLHNLRLPLHSTRPATNLAYRWLAHDLATVGWFTGPHPYFD